MQRSQRITLDEKEIDKLQKLGYIDANLSIREIQKEDIANAIHDLIDKAQHEYTFDILAGKNITINGDRYWQKDDIYTVMTNDFKEFVAESDFGDTYLSVDDLVNHFSIYAIDDKTRSAALRMACAKMKNLIRNSSSE